MIKFEHTIFALPFAIMSAFLAAEGLPGKSDLFWIVLAMVGARSCAMSFNRLADAEIDNCNPRTQTRAIPAALMKKTDVLIFVVLSACLLVVSAHQLNPLAFKLSPIALAIIKNGKKLKGKKLYVPMPNKTIEVTVSDTIFLDKEGKRLNA